jgi:hypothetical protein
MDIHEFNRICIDSIHNKDYLSTEIDYPGDRYKPLIVTSVMDDFINMGYLLGKFTGCQIIDYASLRNNDSNNRNIIVLSIASSNTIEISASDLRILKLFSSILRSYKIRLGCSTSVNHYVYSTNPNTFWLNIMIPPNVFKLNGHIYRLLSALSLFIDNNPCIDEESNRCEYIGDNGTKCNDIALTFPKVCTYHMSHINNLDAIMIDNTIKPEFMTNSVNNEEIIFTHIFGLKRWSGFPRSYKKKTCILCNKPVNKTLSSVKYLCGECYLHLDIKLFMSDYINGFITHSKILRNKNLLTQYLRYTQKSKQPSKTDYSKPLYEPIPMHEYAPNTNFVDYTTTV